MSRETRESSTSVGRRVMGESLNRRSRKNDNDLLKSKRQLRHDVEVNVVSNEDSRQRNQTTRQEAESTWETSRALDLEFQPRKEAVVEVFSRLEEEDELAS
ncbi:Uncharacterized protein TCM_036326 [Theobroma cacao]|uniref:Uncharacterized protein n=1 Tax=Theobroma cacao TaxID=3641 RepID=A0A061FRP5_THECC|nr:Uncharacterized protein TCM_036326 [Theobroma cacao]